MADQMTFDIDEQKLIHDALQVVKLPEAYEEQMLVIRQKCQFNIAIMKTEQEQANQVGS